jgi:hypothetical protein
MLLFFMLSYYVNPLYKMLDSLDGFRSFDKIYTYTFEGDDELVRLNEGITEVTSENLKLRRRLRDLKAKEHNELESDKP